MANQTPPLLSLLQGFVRQATPSAPQEQDAAALWRAAAQQNLLPVLAYEAKRLHLFDDPSINQRMERLLHNTVAGSLNRCFAFESLSATLTAQGIAHMPVKGYYLRQLYPAPELRTFGDIDLLIHEADRPAVHRLMLRLGYQVVHNWEPTYSYRRGAEFYEIHTCLMDGSLDGRSDLQTWFSSAWQYAEPEEGLRFRPAAAFHLIYIVCHLAKHLYSGGAGLRMYLDVAFFLLHHDTTLDWPSIWKEFTALGLDSFLATVLNACRLWFGVETRCPLPAPDEEALRLLLTYTMDADLFGHSRDHAVIRLRNEAGHAPSKSRVLRRMLFPSAAEIESRYTFLQHRHWLLPAAWAARLLANVRHLPAQLHSMKQIAGADAAEVLSYDRFMKRLGL